MSTNGTDGRADRGAVSPAEGAGTPVPVDVSRDRRVRWIWAMFVAGPVVWFTHFMLVYLVAEAGCTGDGPGLRYLDPPVPVVFTLVATGVAVAVIAAAAWWSYRHWQASRRDLAHSGDDASDLAGDLDDDRRRGTLAFAGLLLSLLSIVAVLFTGAPAVVLGPC